MPKISNKKLPLIPHLYQKGRTLYYRLVLPRNANGFPSGKEIRICLQTCKMKEARKAITLLHSHAMQRISESMAENHDESGRRKADARQKLKSELEAKLAEIVNSGNKAPLSQAEIRQRLLGRLIQKLDEDESTPSERYAITETISDGKERTISESEVWQSIAKSITVQADSYDLDEDRIRTTILELILDGAFNDKEITKANLQYIVKMSKIYEGYYLRIIAARRSGDYIFEKNIIANSSITESPILDKSTHKECIMYTELVNRYSDAQLKDGNWQSHMVREHIGILEIFRTVVGDMPINNINRNVIRQFRDKLRCLPPNFTKHKKYKGLSIEQIIEIATTTLSKTRINIIVSALSSCLAWAVKEGLLETNPAIGLALKDERPEIDRRSPFNNDEIRKLFYDGCQDERAYKNPAFYWVPLIALYSGMRLEEICQLECKDVRLVDNIWVFDIKHSEKDDSTKKIKNKSSIRLVPIHDHLLRQGLMDYVNRTKQISERLFPQLNITERTTKYGKQVGKDFSARVRKSGIEGNKTFHSLRHTFAHFFKTNKLDGPIFIQVMGHEQTGIDRRVYGDRYSPKQCYEEVISKLDYGFNKSS